METDTPHPDPKKWTHHSGLGVPHYLRPEDLLAVRYVVKDQQELVTATAFFSEIYRDDWIWPEPEMGRPIGKIVKYQLLQRTEVEAPDASVVQAAFDALQEAKAMKAEDSAPPVHPDSLLNSVLPLGGPYGKLADVLTRAYLQASAGKGKERHAVGDVPFEDQPMATINRQLGSVDGFIYQAHKKSLEAKRLPDGRAQAELLGAINYLAGAVIALDSWAKKD